MTHRIRKKLFELDLELLEKLRPLGLEKLQELMQVRFPNRNINVHENPSFWFVPENLKAMERMERHD